MRYKEKPEGDLISREALKRELGKLDTWSAIDENGEEHTVVDALEVDDIVFFAPDVK